MDNTDMRNNGQNNDVEQPGTQPNDDQETTAGKKTLVKKEEDKKPWYKRAYDYCLDKHNRVKGWMEDHPYLNAGLNFVSGSLVTLGSLALASHILDKADQSATVTTTELPTVESESDTLLNNGIMTAEDIQIPEEDQMTTVEMVNIEDM